MKTYSKTEIHEFGYGVNLVVYLPNRFRIDAVNSYAIDYYTIAVVKGCGKMYFTVTRQGRRNPSYYYECDSSRSMCQMLFDYFMN